MLKDMDDYPLKNTGHKVKEDKCGGKVEEYASSHEEDVCIKKYKTTTYDTPLELTDEADDTSVLDGYTFDESIKDEDATSYETLRKCSNQPMLRTQHHSLCMMSHQVSNVPRRAHTST
jgi:hypothetical protein